MKKEKIELFVHRADFIDWYIQDSEDMKYLAQRVLNDFRSEGKIEWNLQEIFDESGYIPTHIIRNEDDILEDDRDEIEVNEDLYKITFINE
jgi:hypothetical protein